jgi:SPP1 gp7 family putative phage head morphogenesis protein
LTVIPSSRLIASALNRQLFRPMGLRFQWKPQEMSLFQEDEEQRSMSVMHYVQAGMPLHIAVEILGVTLPDGMEYADLGAMISEQQAQRDAMAREMAQRTQPTPQPAPAPTQAEDVDEDDGLNAAVRSAMWKVEAKQFRKWLRKNPTKALDDFEANHLTDEEKETIKAEVSTDADFFPVTLPGIWSGHNIPDAADSVAAWKAVLQLDEDDDEAERRAREAIERAAADNIAEALERQRRALVPSNSPPTSVTDVTRRVDETSGTVRDALRRMLVQSADLGVSVAVAQFDNIGFGFDWTLANTAAREWANRYTGELITMINDTTRRQVQQAVAQWIDNGDPLPALVRELAPTFGRQRAELIAATEVTRAYAEANRQAYIETGVVDSIEWRTAVDERVCPICGPLNGTQTDARNPNFGGRGIPPAHPRCRCWSVPVI